MVKVSVLYPNKAGSRFDQDYYFNRHTPMVGRLLGSALKGLSIESGISGAMRDQPAPYLITCHLVFESTAAFFAAFTQHAAEIMGDIPNFTDVEPVIQLGEIKLSR
jgi:uncharacterized protein (TIGR02118 family)